MKKNLRADGGENQCCMTAGVRLCSVCQCILLAKAGQANIELTTRLRLIPSSAVLGVSLEMFKTSLGNRSIYDVRNHGVYFTWVSIARLQVDRADRVI
jgi:hypothetical protein